MRGVAMQEAVEEMTGNAGTFEQSEVTADDQTPPEEMDPQAISPRQRLALEVFCKGGTMGDAAKAANVSRQTLHRWRAKYPHFALAMSSWSAACLGMAESQLAELAGEAVGTLAKAIKNGDARSATAVLRSLRLLRTYQPLKTPSRRAENAFAMSGMDTLAQALAETPQRGNEAQAVAKPPVNSPPAANQAPSQTATLREGASVQLTSPEPVRSASPAAQPKVAVEATEVRNHTGSSGKVASEQICTASAPAVNVAHNSAKLPDKSRSAIKSACYSALQEVTESYQMLPKGAAQNAPPEGALLASCA